MKNRISVLLTFAVVTLSGLTGCSLVSQPAIPSNENSPYQVVRTAYRDAPIAVSELADGDNFNVNLVKLTANATSDGREITVNGASASTMPSGETLLFLNPGENVVRVTNRDGKPTENMTVSFTPPLAVYITKYFMDVNYSYPVEVRGNVNRPGASVAVNGVPAFVSVDGSFAAHVQLTMRESDIQAVAVDGDEITEYTIIQSLYRGLLTPVYGADYRFQPRLVLPKSTVTIKPGSTASADLTIMLRTYKGVGVEKCAVDMPVSYPGLTATVNLPEFDGYPNINYHPTITVPASADVAPSQYPLRVEFSTASGSSAAANLNVVVEK